MSKKSVHLDEKLHSIIKLIAIEKNSSIEKVVNDLLIEILNYRDAEFEDYISRKIENYNSIELQNSKSEKIQLKDVDTSIVEIAKNYIRSSSSGSKETKVEDTLRCIRYLQSSEKATKSDFIDNCFQGEGSEGSFWKRASEGMHELSDYIGQLHTPSKGHSKYEWKD